MSGPWLTTRNTVLMQQIAGAQAEAILKLPMQPGEMPNSAQHVGLVHHGAQMRQ